MAAKRCSDDDFIALFRTIGATATAKRLGVSERNVYARRSNIEKRLGPIAAPSERSTRVEGSHPARHSLDIKNGEVFIGSDAHLWPGDRSLAQRAFLKLVKERKPKIVILNGDVLDFPQISRHAPIGWEKHPTIQEELEHAQEYLCELELAAGRGVQKAWTLGNHDARFATRLATVAPEYARINGFHLKDHFPNWRACWSAWINGGVVVKHRWKSGINAPRANTLNAGMTMVTGHLHKCNVTGLTDYTGTRYGVDTGCLADTEAPQFTDYTEDSPKDWVSGFCILTFRDGRLMQPELVRAFDKDHVEFRGDVIKA